MSIKTIQKATLEFSLRQGDTIWQFYVYVL